MGDQREPFCSLLSYADMSVTHHYYYYYYSNQILVGKYYAYGAFMHNMGVVAYHFLLAGACAQTVSARVGLINATNVTLL